MLNSWSKFPFEVLLNCEIQSVLAAGAPMLTRSENAKPPVPLRTCSGKNQTRHSSSSQRKHFERRRRVTGAWHLHAWRHAKSRDWTLNCFAASRCWVGRVRGCCASVATLRRAVRQRATRSNARSPCSLTSARTTTHCDCRGPATARRRRAVKEKTHNSPRCAVRRHKTKEAKYLYKFKAFPACFKLKSLKYLAHILHMLMGAENFCLIRIYNRIV